MIRQDDNRQRALDATDIVELVGEHVALKSKGREFVGLCPFHDDRHPSMYVVPHKQIFHCFVCGSGGNAIDFLMKLHGMGFREALEHLATRAGVELAPLKRRAESQQDVTAPSTSRDDLARANAFAQSFFQSIFTHAEHGRTARQLVESRGITPEMVERFGIGAAPDRWDGLEQVVRGKGMPVSHFAEAGLLKEKEGRHYDALRNRLVFPIQDQASRVVGFGARRLNDEDEPKYLNSPESRLFDKGATLFGLKQAARAIQKQRTCIVTEGYTDVIACHQHGFENVVATLGTALTKKHAPVLRRMCDTVILLFDGDDAGQRAADRALDVFFTEPMDVRIAVLPEGRDPDEILKSEGGAERFREMLSGAVDWMEYRFARLGESLDKRGLREGSMARARVIEEEVDRLIDLGLRQLPPIRQRTVVQRLARLAQVDEPTITAAIEHGSRRHRPAPLREGAESDSADGPHADRGSPRACAIGCLLADPALFETKPSAAREILDEGAYGSGPLSDVAAALREETAVGATPTLATVLARVEQPEARELATALALDVSRQTDEDRGRIGTFFRDCVARLERRSHAPQAGRAGEVERKRQDAGRYESSAAGAVPAAKKSPRSETHEADSEALPSEELTEALARQRQRHESLGGNPLAMPRPRQIVAQSETHGADDG